MIEFDHKIFYSTYGFDYYLYKLGTLKAILADVSKFDEQFLSTEVRQADQKDYTRFIKSEIRMTCFHAIETLFELIFALEPNDGVLRDEKLLQSLTTANSKQNYSRIREISNDNGNLDFLDVICKEDKQLPVWMHIFYFKSDFQSHSHLNNDFQESRRAIRYFITRIAGIFSDRAEYNAYKHGIRIMHTLSHVSFSSGRIKDPIYFDLSDTMSLFSIERDKNRIPIAEVIDVIPFDTNLDIEIIQTCYHMIMNIIGLRRSFYSENKSSGSAIMFTENLMRELLIPDPSISMSNIKAKNPIVD